MMSNDSKDLYRWKKWSENRTKTSVTKKPHNIDDIESWLKRVEQASDEAAAITFGRPKRTNYLSNGHEGAMATIDALKDHDAAYTEAQDLLTQWMAEKCSLDDDGDLYLNGDDEYSISSKASAKTDLQSHWEKLLNENDPGMLHAYQGPSSDAVYQEIESRDDGTTVQQIMNDLLDKDMGETKVKRDLGLARDKKKKDPTVTMAARQQKVKENREKKERDRKKLLEERAAQKDTQLKARQMVKKEEAARALRVQQEEMKVQQDMARIRKQLQETRQREEEERNRRRLAEESARLQVEREEEARKQAEARQRLEAERQLEQQKTELLRREAERKAREEEEEIKCKHRHFQAWYQLILDRRMKMGKVRALSDWRCLLRSWNAWRAHHRACIAERESREAELFVKESHRKNQAAHNHLRRHLLHKYFIFWRIWMHSVEEAAKIEEAKLKTRSKMDAFLEAAASGRLWTDRSNLSDESQQNGHPQGGKKSSSVPTSANSTIPGDQSERSAPPTLGRSHASHLTKPPKPKHAWQVTRKHIKLAAEEIAHIGEGEDVGLNRNQNNVNMHLDLTSVNKSVGSTESRRTTGFKVNNFEHRYANQQKMLLEQRQQLVEQRRLIEDLQAAQREQVIRQEISAIQNGGIPTGGSSGVTGGSGGTGSENNSAVSTERSDAVSSVSTASSGPATTNRTNTTSSTTSGMKTSTSQPAMLKGMEDRAALRAQRKAEREERMRKKEEEKLAQMRAEEERKTAEEEKKKQEEIERRREKKRLERQKELEKKQRLEKIAEMNNRADLHYRQSLMRNFGLKPWRKLVTTARQNKQSAVDRYSHILQRRCLLPWHQLTQEMQREKCAIADEKYRVILLQRGLNSWKRYGHYLSIQYQRARRHYALQMKGRLFRAWQDFTTNQKLAAWRNEELATEHSEKRMMKVVLVAWRKYPKMLKQEKERERRREEMRKKVSSLLPDFGLS